MLPLSGTGSWIELLVYLAASLVGFIYLKQVLFRRFFRSKRLDRASLNATVRRFDNEFAEINPDSVEIDLEEKLHDVLHTSSFRVHSTSERQPQLPDADPSNSNPESEPILWK